MRKSEITVLAIILVSFAIGVYLYPRMPERMASHWDIEGNVDGHIPKLWGLFIMPLISFGLFLLFVAIPKIDPLKRNIAKFRKHFDVFVASVTLFLFYLYLLTILWNLGSRFKMNQLLIPAFSGLFFYVGILVENAKRNWSIGIRTPWTLSNDNVWNKTHKLGGRLFKIAGMVALIGMALDDYAFYLVVFPIIIVSVYTVVYSYLEYQKLNNPKRSKAVQKTIKKAS